MSKTDFRDEDNTPIKPLALTGIVLLSAGAGLAAGLLICWLFCNDDEPDQRQTQNLVPMESVSGEWS